MGEVEGKKKDDHRMNEYSERMRESLRDWIRNERLRDKRRLVEMRRKRHESGLSQFSERNDERKEKDGRKKNEMSGVDNNNEISLLSASLSFLSLIGNHPLLSG